MEIVLIILLQVFHIQVGKYIKLEHALL